MTTIRNWLLRPWSCTNLSVTSVMAAYKKMVNTRLNVHGVWMLMENCLVDREHSEIKNIVMFSTSKVLDYSCKKNTIILDGNIQCTFLNHSTDFFKILFFVNFYHYFFIIISYVIYTYHANPNDFSFLQKWNVIVK